MTQHTGTHPRERAACAGCGNTPAQINWEYKRRLPQVGKTYECSNCGHEVYVYDAGDPGETIMQWRPVTQGMVTSLQFFSVVGEWPDSATEDLVMQGLERLEAIDYHVVDREGLNQTEWADMRGVDQSSVSENVAKASDKFSEE